LQRNISDVKRTEALAQRRAEQVITAAEIARDTTGTLEVKTLLQKTVNLVRERFGFYHASIFLIDPLGEYALLRESTGTAGEKMVQAGHRLAVGSKSIVGQVTATRKALIVNDVTNTPNYYPNPLLPDTRSELAIPLRAGERILGALDVQSTQIDAFKDEDISILQILADQLAVAVVNGELFARTQELLAKHRLLRQITTAASTSTSREETLLNVVRGLREAMICDRIAILMLNQDGQLQMEASSGYEGTTHLELRIAPGQGITGMAAVEKRAIRVDNAENDSRYLTLDPEIRSELAIPILFSEELIGVLNLESKQTSAFDENDQEILGALGSNLGGVIANIRLLQQVRQQVEREQLLFEVTSKIRRSVDLETILETSTREICRALGAQRARIQITSGRRTLQPESSSPVMLDGGEIAPTNGHNGHNGSNGHNQGLNGGSAHNNGNDADRDGNNHHEQEADE
jgi:GAF domain-containing protein